MPDPPGPPLMVKPSESLLYVRQTRGRDFGQMQAADRPHRTEAPRMDKSNRLWHRAMRARALALATGNAEDWADYDRRLARADRYREAMLAD
jgi:hypothetical protein